ncbi:MAG: hypothetical protein U0X75_19900 [Acidobacteriota bacterium]
MGDKEFAQAKENTSKYGARQQLISLLARAFISSRGCYWRLSSKTGNET